MTFGVDCPGFQIITAMEVEKMRILLLGMLAAWSVTAAAQDSGVAAGIESAMASDIRTEADVARDRNRKPVETLQFFGLEDDMRVLELMPGGGWYTKLLAPVLREDGKLYVSIFADNVRNNLLKEPGFDRVEVLDIGVDPVRTEPYGLRDLASATCTTSRRTAAPT
jgi:predicted methyltransferase